MQTRYIFFMRCTQNNETLECGWFCSMEFYFYVNVKFIFYTCNNVTIPQTLTLVTRPRRERRYKCLIARTDRFIRKFEPDNANLSLNVHLTFVFAAITARYLWKYMQTCEKYISRVSQSRSRNAHERIPRFNWPRRLRRIQPIAMSQYQLKLFVDFA